VINCSALLQELAEQIGWLNVRRIFHEYQVARREVQVCALLIRGQSDTEIALHLGTRVGTVKTHAAGVAKKRGLDHRQICWDFFVRLIAGEGDECR
jgi:DNA-binding NarL/FixJ family response regulator